MGSVEQTGLPPRTMTNVVYEEMTTMQSPLKRQQRASVAVNRERMPGEKQKQSRSWILLAQGRPSNLYLNLTTSNFNNFALLLLNANKRHHFFSENFLSILLFGLNLFPRISLNRISLINFIKQFSSDKLAA